MRQAANCPEISWSTSSSSSVLPTPGGPWNNTTRALPRMAAVTAARACRYSVPEYRKSGSGRRRNGSLWKPKNWGYMSIGAGSGPTRLFGDNIPGHLPFATLLLVHNRVETDASIPGSNRAPAKAWIPLHNHTVFSYLRRPG